MVAEAELIVTGSVIRTADRRKPVVEASAVCDGRILDLGTSAEMRAHRGPDTRMLDVGDAAVYPGFVDVPGSLACAALACAALSHARLARGWSKSHPSGAIRMRF